MTSQFDEELMKSFHQQFAENQNQHQQSFIQVLSVLLTVLVGYGYVITNGGKLDVAVIKVHPPLLAFAHAIASLIITFGLLLVCNNAHGYRRDQFVVARIRRKAGLIGSNVQDKSFIFPAHFDPAISLQMKLNEWDEYRSRSRSNPMQLWKWLNLMVSWMPNFYNILFFVLAILHLILCISLLSNPFDDFTLALDINKPLHGPYTAALVFWLALTVYVCRRLLHFFKRLRSLYNNQ